MQTNRPRVATPQAAAPASPASSPANQVVVDINTISKYINENPTLRPKISALLRRGFLGNLEQVVDQVNARLDSDAAALEALHSPDHLVWNTLTTELPFNFFTECCMFCYEGVLYCLGPQDDRNLALLKIEILRNSDPNQKEFEDEQWGRSDSEKCGDKTLIKITGSPPPAVVLFRKMPFHFIRDKILYLGYIDEQENFTFTTLDLQTWSMEPLRTAGETPRVNQTVAFEGCYIENKVHLVSNPSVLYTLEFPELQWSRQTLFGEGPTALSGSSNYWNGKILVFGHVDGFVYELSLKTQQWSSAPMKNSPKITLRDCHLMRQLDETFVLIRMTDNSEVWILDPTTYSWEKKDAVGLRPGDYSTNPTYVIENGVLYCLGGQSVKKHSLFQGTPPVRPPPMPIPQAAPPAPIQAPVPAPAPATPPPALAPAAAMAFADPAQPRPVRANSEEFDQAAALDAAPPAPLPPPTPPIVTPPVTLPTPQPAAAAPAAQLMIQSERKNMLMRIVLKRREAVTEATVLASRLSRMYDNPFTDVAFTFPDGKRIKAHRALLATNARFNKLFLDHLDSSELPISEWDSTTFSALVRHFYERLDLRLDEVDPCKLYNLAEAFQEGSLKVKVTKFLASRKDPFTLLDSYKLALSLEETPCNNRLKRKAEEDLSQEFPKIAKTPEWTKFCAQNPTLLPSIFVVLGQRKSCY